MTLEVVLLSDRIHKREEFECRDEALKSFLKIRANQEHKKNISDTYVLVNNSEPQIILGYFTLSNNGISLDNLPKEYKKHFPNYPSIGTVLLGRMARDHNKSSPGFGEIILKEAIKKSLERGSFVALEVVAKNKFLVSYYMSFGFIRFLDDTSHLFLPRETMEKLI
jgi:predicted GNAT family N-acyltransferase